MNTIEIFHSCIVMNRQKLSNISLADFRRYLFEQGCTRVEQGTKGRGGHEKLFPVLPFIYVLSALIL